MNSGMSRINLQCWMQSLLPIRARLFLNNLRLIRTYALWYLDKEVRRTSKIILPPLLNKYTGCRCVVIGNGPSLKRMDLDLLKNEFTFGLNRFYLLFEELGFETTFLVAINRLVLKQFGNEISIIKNMKFINWAYRKEVNGATNVVFLPAKPAFKMDGDIINGYYGMAGTVTNVAIELAFFMGFSEVLLIGVDHSFKETGKPSLAIVSEGEDQNHFYPNYFGKGTIWQLPDYTAMERGYTQAKALFEASGRQIFDATKGGELNIFPKVNFEMHLKNSIYENRRSFLKTS